MHGSRTQCGSLLVEAIASLAIFGILLASAFKYASERADDLKDQSAAQYQSQVMAAAKKYILDNYSAVLAASTSTTPAVITVAMLQGTGYLPNSFQPSNSYVQSPCVLALQPSSNQIHALIVTEGGSAIPSKRTPAIAALIGATGGYIPSDSPTLARGAFGGWQLATTHFVSQNCSGTAAGSDHLAAAVFFDAGNVAPDYVYRGAVPGHPEFNSMTTPLSMKAVVTAGTSDGLCIVGNGSTYGRIAVDSNGAVMSCQLGVWLRQTGYWKDPVANYAALPASNNTQGDVRLTTDLGRAYSWNGSAWIPLAVDQNGNLSVPGTVTFNQAQVNSVVTAGGACSSTGLLARSSAGALLSCQSGIWTMLGGGSCPAGTIRLVTESMCVDTSDGPAIAGAPYGNFGTFVNPITTYNDWVYCSTRGMTLPDVGELYVMYQNRTTIGMGSAWYYSRNSTSNVPDTAFWCLNFGTGTWSNGCQGPGAAYRCVRRL